jgi:hypothetical protein
MKVEDIDVKAVENPHKNLIGGVLWQCFRCYNNNGI